MAVFALAVVTQRATQAAGSATMTVNAPAAVQVGDTFVVNIDISGASAYKSFQYHLAYASSAPFTAPIVTEYVSDTKTATLANCIASGTTFPLASYSMFTGCALLSGADQAANGTVATVTLKCVANGTATLHLVGAGEGYAQITKMNDSAGAMTVNMVGDTVDCGEAPATATPTATATATQTRTPTATATVTQTATATQTANAATQTAIAVTKTAQAAATQTAQIVSVRSATPTAGAATPAATATTPAGAPTNTPVSVVKPAVKTPVVSGQPGLPRSGGGTVAQSDALGGLWLILAGIAVGAFGGSMYLSSRRSS